MSDWQQKRVSLHSKSADEPAYNVQLLSDITDDTMRAEDFFLHTLP